MKYVISKVPKKRPEYFLILKKKISEAGIECEVIEEGKDLLLKVEEQDLEKANTIKKKYRSELGEEIASQFSQQPTAPIPLKEVSEGLKNSPS